MILLKLRSYPDRVRRAASGMSTHAGRAALRHGVAPTWEPQQMLRRLNPAMVLDVGANRGQFALDVLTACPKASLVSFEPLREEADVYERILGPIPRVHLVRSAVGEVSGRAIMHVSAAADSSSLHVPTELQASTFPGTQKIGSEDVQIVRLDDVRWPVEVPTSTLLKIDVQGHELGVLSGANALLKRIRWVYVEVSLVELYEGQALASEVFDALSACGYALSDLSTPVRRDGRTVQVDALFERTAEAECSEAE